jgi:superfamily II DNA/RNA helicase
MMDYESIRQSLQDRELIKGTTFTLLREISRHVNNEATHDLGRDLVIRALAVVESFNVEEQAILTTLVRSVGLFPYMKPSIERADLDDYLAYELHRADGMEGEIIFHSLQARIFNQLMSGANVVLSASTSVGKSLIIDALVASRKYKKMVVVVPTIALIDEIRRRLDSRFGAECAIITHVSQRSRPDRMTIFVLTQERVLSRDDLSDIDFFVVDEFYKVDLASSSESDRAIDLNLAFTKLSKSRAQFYLLGPNIQDVSGLARFEYHFIPSEFSTVAVDIVQMALPTRGDQRSNALLELCKALDGPTIIYCQSPRSASEVASLLADSLGELADLTETADAVAWMGEKYHPEWSACSALRKGIGVHHGGIPRALQQYFIRLFNERKIPFLVCTSTIIEGVNTVAKNVIVYDRRKSQSVLDHFTYRNIVGRAARMREYFVGKVFVLESAPNEEDYAVEFAVGLQDADTPFGLLLHLEEDDLADISRERLARLFSESSLSPSTLRLNRHVPVSSQEAIAARIRGAQDELGATLTWKGIPTGEELSATCDLIYEFLASDVLPDYGVHSGASLAFHINKLRIERDLSGYVKHNIETKFAEESVSQSVERSLKFVRNVVCQRFPRDLMVLDAIQRDIYQGTAFDPGSYALFAEQAENLFLPSALFALDEYGLPIQTAQQLSPRLLPAEDLDEVLAHLSALPLSGLDLSKFEVSLLQQMNLRGSLV